MRASAAVTLLALLIVLVNPMPVASQDTTQAVPDKPELTVRIVPPEPYLQEQIIQTVRVVAAQIFEELVLDLPPVENADVIVLQQPKTRKFKTYGGEGYIFETKRAIFPKASGAFRLAPVRVSGSVALSRDERESFALKSDPVLFDIKPPPADFKGPSWLVARRVEIEESWSTPPDDLRVGDHVTHTVQAVATGATGGHLPELDHGRTTGVTILPGRTERSTEVNANEVIGRIERSFELRIDTDQPVNISPVRVIWWNTDTEIEWRSAAKAVRIEPLPRDVETLVQNLMTEAKQTHETGRYGIIVLAVIGGLALLALPTWFLIAKRRRAPEDRVLIETVRKKPEPIDVVGALLIWAETAFPREKPMSLERLKQLLGDQAAQQLAVLQGAAFGPGIQDFDIVASTEKIISAARRRRGRNPTDIGRHVLDYLIGPKSHLANIGEEPRKST